MFTLPNILSFLRLPLAFLLLDESPMVRTVAIIGAGMTDFLDGRLARHFKQTSRFGTVLDPLTDKFFVMMALGIFIAEGRISFLEVGTMLSRDIAVGLFGLYLIITGNFGKYKIRSIWSGKVMTTLQFFVLLLLANQWVIPSPAYSAFLLLGIAALCELCLSKETPLSETE